MFVDTFIKLDIYVEMHLDVLLIDINKLKGIFKR